jgi:hypothetical protein
MSLAKLHHQKARKEYTCEKCQATIPKGHEYIGYTVGFRSKYVHRRHTDCAPRPSERESSMLADAYAAVEGAEDSMDGLGSPDEFADVMADCASGIREVAEEYRAAAESMGSAGEENNERADTLDAVADELESVDFESCTMECEECEGTGKVNGDAETDCDNCDGEGTVFDEDAAREIAQEALDGIEWP